MIMCILMGFSGATIFLLPWSMLPDVVDDFAMRQPSCKDMEPLFFSCYAFCSKLAGGLSVGISTMTLQFVGYRAGACNHGDGVVTALIVLFSPVPIALLLIGMVFFRFYPINERQSSQLQEQLSTVHSEAPASSSKISERPTALQPPHTGVASSSHHFTNTNMLHKSDSSSGCHNHDDKSLVTSTGPPNASRSPSGEYSKPKSVVLSSENPQCRKQKRSTYQHAREDKLGRNFPENNSGSFSSRSKVKSKVSWV